MYNIKDYLFIYLFDSQVIQWWCCEWIKLGYKKGDITASFYTYHSKSWCLVPIFKRGGQRVHSNYSGITLLSLNGKVYFRVLQRRLWSNCVSRKSRVDLALAVEWWTSSFPSLTAGGSLGVCPSGLHVLCGSRGGSHPGPSGGSAGDTVGNMAYRAHSWY